MHVGELLSATPSPVGVPSLISMASILTRPTASLNQELTCI